MIVTIVGARPNYMKAAPIHEACCRAGVDHQIIHTGQHYDAAMSKVFFDDLAMPRPAVNLGVGSGTHAQQTAAVMVGLEQYFTNRRPDAVLVVGDINSTMAGAIVCAKMGIYCAHVEAGLRSGDWTMPEEVNRVITDSVCDLLLTPSQDAEANLLREGCQPEQIVFVGNVMIDTLLQHLERARGLNIPQRFGVLDGRYAVATLHRPSNVDDPSVFHGIVQSLSSLSHRVPVIFPVHPRTAQRLADPGMVELLAGSPNLKTCEPLGYLDFLSLTSRAGLILTDSGGLQEESTVLGIPCLTLRQTTERPITVEIGTNRLVGTDPRRILGMAEEALAGKISGRIPERWDGKSADRIVEAVLAKL